MPNTFVLFVFVAFCFCFSEGAVAKFTCKEEGKFADPNSEVGNTYYECKQLRKGVFTRVKKTCPDDGIFNAETQDCNDNADSFELEFLEETTTAIPEFECTARGRFADFSDKTCRAYFLCNQLFNGSFVKTRYTCPMSNFDPNLHRCAIDYVCPWTTTTVVVTEEDTTSTTEEVTTTRAPTTEETTTVLTTTEESNLNTVTPERTTILSTVTTDWSSNITSTATTTTTTQSSCAGIDDFTCEKVGRFKNDGDCSCQWYYLCNQLHNGTFIQTPYKCPKNSIFDPSISICSLLISCPSTEQFIVQ